MTARRRGGSLHASAGTNDRRRRGNSDEDITSRDGLRRRNRSCLEPTLVSLVSAEEKGLLFSLGHPASVDSDDAVPTTIFSVS